MIDEAIREDSANSSDAQLITPHSDNIMPLDSNEIFKIREEAKKYDQKNIDASIER